MTILGDGKVGIGTTNPGKNLHIFGGAWTGIRLDDDGFQNWDIVANHSGSTGRLDIWRGDGTSHAMSIVEVPNSSNVGIGTTGPAAKLHLSSGTLLVDGDAATAFKVGVSTFIINSEGNVGIGTTPTGGKLEITSAGNPNPNIQINSAQGRGIRIDKTGGGETLLYLIQNDTFNNKFLEAYGGGETPLLAEINGNGGAYFAGNVGIGTTDPAVALGDGGSPRILNVNGGAGYGLLRLTSTATGAGVSMGGITFGSTGYSGAEKRTTFIGSLSDDASTVNPTGHLQFWTTNAGTITEKLRITAGGNVRIGNHANDAYLLTVDSDMAIGQGTVGCVVDRDGTIIAGTCISDARLKRDVRPLDPVLGRLSALRPVTYNWRAEEFPEFHFGDSAQTGLVAQEVEKGFPELVETDPKGFKRVNYSQLPLYLLQAVKDQQAEIAALRKEVAELKAK